MPERRALLDAVKALTAALESSLQHTSAGNLSFPASDNSARSELSVDVEPVSGDDPGIVSQVKVLGMTAEEFRRLRRESGYTQAEAAKKLGVASRTVTRWEAGKSRIDVWKAKDIRFALQPGSKAFAARHGRLLDKLADEYANVSSGQAGQQ